MITLVWLKLFVMMIVLWLKDKDQLVINVAILIPFVTFLDFLGKQSHDGHWFDNTEKNLSKQVC